MLAEPFYDYLIRLLIALAIGGIVGLERELKGKPAGIRTNMLMCIGACLIMIISIEVSRTAKGIADPGRIAAQVITGVGFLCAGTIIRSRFHVSGLTTAATIWALAALGLAIGAGYIVLSIAGTVLITVTLVFVSYIERGLRKWQSTHVVQLALDNKMGIVGSVLEVFTRMKITSEALDVNRTGDIWTATFEYTVPLVKHHRLVESLSEIDGVQEVTEL